MQKYLVTGGAGFIGCHLVEKLVKLGKDVVAYDDLSFGKMENIQEYLDKAKLVKADLNDYDAMEKTVREFRPDVVVHLAAIHFIPYCNKNPRTAVQVNVAGTYTLLEICSKYPPKKILFASTAGVYPPSHNPHHEMDETKPFDIYGATKICGEVLIQLFTAQTLVPSVNCRFSNVYGQKETNDHVIPHIMNQLKMGKTTIELGNVSPKRDYIYVSDIADALFEISLADISGTQCFNTGTGEEYSVEELISKIGSIIGVDIRIDSIDALRRKVDRPHLCLDISKIKERIGWTPKYDIDKGLSALVRFELRE